MAFDQSVTASANTADETDGTSANLPEVSLDEKVALQIFRLMHAYSLGGTSGDESSSIISVDV
jgi:hypothetical protein